jgi:hypothetical protein
MSIDQTIVISGMTIVIPGVREQLLGLTAAWCRCHLLRAETGET